MKNNTQKTKMLLQQAIIAMPQDFALAEARSYLNAAIKKIEQVERKRENRNKIEQEEYKKYWGQPNENPSGTLDYIDNLIKEEKKKIKELEDKKKRNIDDDNEDLQPIFG